MASSTSQKPYPSEPAPRSFKQWCTDLGIICESACPAPDTILTFDMFFNLPNARLIRTEETELYKLCRQHADAWGKFKTVQEWLDDFNWEIVDPTPEDIQDLNLILGHDEFHTWSGGRVTAKEPENKGLLAAIKRIFN